MNDYAKNASKQTIFLEENSKWFFQFIIYNQLKRCVCTTIFSPSYESYRKPSP